MLLFFYLYDDRGCEVIAKDIETLRPIVNDKLKSTVFHK
ncbi:DUF3885 domain-containing protein [Alkalihalobacillus sp. MEB130]|nr:DUF3885 domain-containing protein [Alkalihalobacillus sp. MEB130]MDT8860298.1 DUF3885 domain-containing protein [Alkalihalobacillus sp. MEB130]